MSDPTADIQRLQQENAALRAELQAAAARQAATGQARRKALRIGWSLFFPLFDRKKIVRSGMQLFTTLSGYATQRDAWPTPEAVIEDGRAFALAMLRFSIRRRSLMLLLSLIAFVIPGIQIWLVYRQNEIIENQNKFFEIDVFDTTARGLTSGTASSRQMTSALLAKVDLDLLKGMVEGVFESDIGGAFTASDVDARARRMQGAAFRGYLIGAMSQQIRHRAAETGLARLHDEAFPMFAAVMGDARLRVAELLRIGRSAATADSALAEEVSNYLVNLVQLMRTHYRLALSVGEEPRYFANLAPVLARAAGRRLGGEPSPFEDVFFHGAMEELLLDLAQGVPFGEPEPPIAADPGTIRRLTQEGFQRLKDGVGDHARVNWSNLESLVGVR